MTARALLLLTLLGCEELFDDCDLGLARPSLGDACDLPADVDRCAKEGVRAACVNGRWQVIRPEERCGQSDPECELAHTG